MTVKNKYLLSETYRTYGTFPSEHDSNCPRKLSKYSNIARKYNSKVLYNVKDFLNQYKNNSDNQALKQGCLNRLEEYLTKLYNDLKNQNAVYVFDEVQRYVSNQLSSSKEFKLIVNIIDSAFEQVSSSEDNLLILRN